MSGERKKPQEDPAEGAPEIIDEELRRQSQRAEEKRKGDKPDRRQSGQDADGGSPGGSASNR